MSAPAFLQMQKLVSMAMHSDTNLFVVAEISALTLYCQTLVHLLVVSQL